MSGPLIVPAVKRHTATVIMAHGLGDSGAGWVSLAENWRRRQKFDEVKFIFPNAPTIPVTVNRGYRMPAWFDIISFGGLQSEQDEPGVLKSRDYFHDLIKTEINGGIPSNRIVIGGFSQGGAMSLFSGITCPSKLAGIIGLSCFLPLHTIVKDLIPADNANKDTGIFMGHGSQDPVVTLDKGQMSAHLLKEWGFKVDFRIYPGLAHSADPDEIDDVEKYLNGVIPPLGDKSAGV